MRIGCDAKLPYKTSNHVMSLYPSFPFLLAITRTNFCLLTSFSGIKYTMRIGCNTKLPYKTSNLCNVLVPKLPAPVRNQPHRILSSHSQVNLPTTTRSSKDHFKSTWRFRWFFCGFEHTTNTTRRFLVYGC